MAIVQISKIQQRSGNLVDLPQLDDAEFGWANDEKRLFIGKTTPNENIEVLTSYSNITFAQIDGASNANLDLANISSNGAEGQMLGLTYSGTQAYIVNKGGDPADANSPGGLVNLGNVSNVLIYGGAIGYVLETDGTGNLSWTSKGTLRVDIEALSNATPIIMTVAETTPYVNGTEITISGVAGANANTIVNSQTFYVKVANDFPTTGNVELYTDAGLTTASIGTNLTATPNTGIATTLLGGAGSATAGGSNSTVQYNSGNIIVGDSGFTFNDTGTKLLTVNGNISTGNLSASGNLSGNRLISTVAIGTAPLVVTSTTQVANLNVANAGHASTANTVTNAAQSNITSLGTLTSLGVNGALTAVTITANTGVISGNGSGLTALNASNISTGTLAQARLANSAITINGTAISLGSSATITANTTQTLTFGSYLTGTSFNGGTANTIAVDATTTNTGSKVVARDSDGSFSANIITATLSGAATTSGTVTSAAQPNITSVGTLTSLAVTGNITAGNVYANSGTIGASLLTGTLTTASQPNVTSLGTLSSLTVTGNTATGGVKTDNYYYANGVSISFAGTYSNSNVASYLPTYTGNISAGNISATGNIVGANLSTSGNVTAGNFIGAGAGSPTIASSSTLSISATSGVSINNLTSISTGSNVTAGTITGNYTLTSGSKLQATYADLAEYYEADKYYEPGTVLEFGGEKEVTLAQDGTTKVAGVVSTNPAYVMNTNCPGIAVAIALQGRVPCKVRGKVQKGDLMVSAGNGYARPWNNAQIGTILGKAIQNFDGVEGVIEIAVGRL